MFLLQDGGHSFTIKGEEVPLAGTVTFFSGDNLDSQLVGGFKEGSGAHLKCRHCMGSSEDVKTKVGKTCMFMYIRHMKFKPLKKYESGLGLSVFQTLNIQNTLNPNFKLNYNPIYKMQ